MVNYYQAPLSFRAKWNVVEESIKIRFLHFVSMYIGTPVEITVNMQAVEKIKNLDVTIEAPPAKAHTLRALIIGSLADGQTVIENPLLGQDQLNVIRCLKILGVDIEVGSEEIIVNGLGGSYKSQGEELNIGESGVGMNFLASAACLADKPVILTGAKRITERPISEIVSGLRQLGCKIEYLQNEGYPPIKINPIGIQGGQTKMSGRDCSQYFSSIVVSAPYAETPVTIICSDELTEKPYVDITIQMAAEFGIQTQNINYKKFVIPNGRYKGRTIKIEGDYSSASFFMLAAAICKSKVTITNLRADTKQGDSEFITLMEKMGSVITRNGDKVIIEGKSLKAIQQDMSDVPDLVPPAAIACAFAEGTSRLTNIGHLRHKECDRLAVMASELAKMGISASCQEDALVIEGNPAGAHGAVIDPHNDHRIAMSFAAAGLVTGNQKIKEPACVAKSFPDFWERFAIFHK
ncbi:MAG: 3-phosphoshikimate 1-carboxyvinyltransferase [Sedimentisphaerales bacterium]|nr:3-phosphoshikimate 1-carboxyvinyltransferase [Sedimentisphaerales bacterium]